jgi:hypothetical protein
MRQEIEHIRRGDLQRIFSGHPEERLQIEGHRPQRVRPAPARHELQIPVRQPLAQPETPRAGWRSAGKGEFGVQGGARAGGAVDGDGPAERLHAVFQPDQAGAPHRIGSASPVITDAEVQDRAGRLRADLDDRRVRVLGRVGECFGDDVVGGDLDPFR